MHEPVARALTQPDGAAVETEGGERLRERDLRGVVDVERAAHHRGDRSQAVQLVLANAVLLIEVIDVAARDARCESLDHAFQPALRKGEHLVAARLAFQRLDHQPERCTPVHGQYLDERLERHALRGAKTAVRAGSLVVLVPRKLLIDAKRCQQDVDE